MAKPSKTPRKHVTPRTRTKKIGPGGSYKDWADLDTTATWAPPARSGQRTDVRTHRPLNELIKGALEKRARVPNTRPMVDIGAGPFAPRRDDPHPQAPIVTPSAKAAPQAGANPALGAESAAGFAPGMLYEAAKATADRSAWHAPMATPEQRGARRQHDQVRALRYGIQGSQYPNPSARPEGWWDNIAMWLSRMWKYITTGVSPEAQEAESATAAAHANMAARRSAYASSDEPVDYDASRPEYGSAQATLDALSPYKPNVAAGAIPRFDRNLNFTPEAGFQRGLLENKGYGWYDDARVAWDNALTHLGLADDGNSNHYNRVQEMKQERARSEIGMQLHGYDRDTAQYSPEARPDYTGSRKTFGYDESGNVVRDAQGQRKTLVDIANMSNRLGRVVTPENTAEMTNGLEKDSEGNWVDHRTARASWAPVHARNRGYANEAEFYADGWRLGPNGSVIYPERLKDVAAKQLFDMTEAVIGRGVNNDVAREVARQQLILDGVYVPSAQQVIALFPQIEQRAQALQASGMEPAKAREQAKQELEYAPYLDQSLYDAYAGGAEARTNTARAEEALVRNILTGAFNRQQMFSPDSLSSDGVDDAAAGFANGATLGIGGGQLSRYRLRAEIKGAMPHLSDEDVNKYVEMAMEAEARGVGDKTTAGAMSAVAGSMLPFGLVGRGVGAAGSAVLGRALPAAAKALPAAAKAWSSVGAAARALPGATTAGKVLRGAGRVGRYAAMSPLLMNVVGDTAAAATDSPAVGAALKAPVLAMQIPFTAAGTGADAVSSAVHRSLNGSFDAGRSADLIEKTVAGASRIGNMDVRRQVLANALMPLAQDQQQLEELVDKVMESREPGALLRQARQQYGSPAQLASNYRLLGEQQNYAQELARTAELIQNGGLDEMVRSGQITRDQAMAIVQQVEAHYGGS